MFIASFIDYVLTDVRQKINPRKFAFILLLMRIYLIIVVLMLGIPSYGQLIRKKVESPPSPLEKIAVYDHFSQVSLHEVYQTFISKYNVRISYDSNYCKKRYFSFWFTGTPLPLAIEITTRDPGTSYRPLDKMSFQIDTNLQITVKRIGKILTYDDAGILIRDAPIQNKFTGPPQKRNLTISGKVVDITSGEPIPSANIVVAGTSIGTACNPDGLFSLSGVPADTSTISVSYIGYTTQGIYLAPDMQTSNIQIELYPTKESTLNEIIVTANRSDVMQMSQDNLSVVKLSPAKLAELPNVGEKDVMRAFQLMPGISASNESSSGLYVRGGTPDQNLVTYDGFTIYHVDHLYGFFSAFNANAVKDVQLYKGGFDSKFGGRLSSVMELTGKEADKKKFNFGGDVSLLSGNLFTEIPLTENVSILAAWRRSWKGPIYNWISSSFNQSSETEDSQQQPTAGGPGAGPSVDTKTTSYFSDLNTKVVFTPTSRDNLSYSYFYSIDKLDNSTSFTAPAGFGGSSSLGLSNGSTDLTRYGNVGMSLKWTRKWTEKFNGNILASYSDYYSKRDRSNERTSTDSLGEQSTVKTGILETNDLTDISIKADYNWDLLHSNSLNFGLFGTDYNINYAYNQDDTTDVITKKGKGILMGGYLTDKITLFGKRLEVKPGVRLSYFDVTEKTYWEPRCAAGVKITDKLSLKASCGQFYQFANRITREDVLSGSKDFWILSDKDKIPVSSSIHYISGLSYETKKYLFSVEAYKKELKDISEYSLRFSSNRFFSTTVKESFYTGYGYAQGLELLAQKKTGKFTGWISYSFGQARNHFDIYGEEYFPANQDVTHELKVVGVYKYKRWDFSATWIFATGRPYTAPAGSYTITLLDGTTEDYFTVTTKNSLRLPDYHRLDLSFSYHIWNQNKKDIGYIGLSIFNAYNRTNTWYKQYYISDGSVIESTVNYLGLTPNLTLSLRIR